jgi:hypothetical protein
LPLAATPPPADTFAASCGKSETIRQDHSAPALGVESVLNVTLSLSVVLTM